MDLLERLQKLKSAWGILSVGSVLFPGAAYWMDFKSIKASPLNEYYLMTAVPLGALALLLALTLGETPRSRIVRNAIVLLALIVVPGALIGFVTASVDRQDAPSPEKGPERCAVFAFGNNLGEGYETFTYKNGGRLKVLKRPCECYHSGALTYDCKQTGRVETIEDVINPDEYNALIWFNVAIVTLTMMFTLLAAQFGPGGARPIAVNGQRT